MALTPEEQEAKRQLAECDTAITEAKLRRRTVLQQHTHRIEAKEPVDRPRWKGDENPIFGSACCCVCNKDLGWYCPKSPDHTCHYFSEVGLVLLLDGTAVETPADHDSEGESYDRCIYCEDPRERN